MTTTTRSDSPLMRRTVEAHLDGAGYDVDLISSSDRAAISIARGVLFHKAHDAGWLDEARTTFAVIQTEPFVPAAKR